MFDNLTFTKFYYCSFLQDIVDKFYNKEIEVEDFLDQFKKARKLMHLRRVKVDKMKELMHKRLEVRPKYFYFAFKARIQFIELFFFL